MGAKRSFQRFEQCIQILNVYATPAQKALEAQHLFDPKIQKAVTELAEEAIRDFRDATDWTMEDDVLRLNILRKIDDIELIVMFPEEVLNISKINEIYDDLELNGTESLVKMWIGIRKHSRRIEMGGKDSWSRDLLRKLRQNGIKYDTDTNILSESF